MYQGNQETQKLETQQTNEFSIKSKFVENFPFKEVRPVQTIALSQLERALERFDVVILEAPTGTGKSAIAMSACNAVIRDKYNTLKAEGAAGLAPSFELFRKDHKPLTTLATANKLLQDQYLKDFANEIADIRGKANYKCENFPTFNCADSPCALKEKADCGRCGYKQAIGEALQSTIISVNYSALMTLVPRQFVPEDNTQFDLLICDEAHKLPDVISSNNTIEIKLQDLIDTKLLNIFNNKFPDHKLNETSLPNLKTEAEAIDFFCKILECVPKKVEEAAFLLKGIDTDIPEAYKDLAAYAAFDGQQKVSASGAWYCKNKYFFENLITKSTSLPAISNSVLELQMKEGAIIGFSIKPVFLKEYTHELLKSYKKTILMSATILDFNTFMELLGLDQQNVGIIRLDTDFPKENRPFYFSYNVGPINKNNLQQKMPNIIETCKTLLKKHSKEKGIIHGYSYQICKSLADNINSSRILFPKKASEQKFYLNKHQNSKEPTVLISPSMEEGVDLKDDLSRFQILVRLPWPYIGDPVIQKRTMYYPNYVNMLTALRLIQSYGRSVRSNTDTAATYILDGMFYNFVQSNPYVFPDWFLEAIVWQQPLSHQ